MRRKLTMMKQQRPVHILAGVILVLLLLVGCGLSTTELVAVEYAPLPGDDWAVSTPEAEELDPGLVAALYYDAAELETLYSLLVVKNGRKKMMAFFPELGAQIQDQRKEEITVRQLLQMRSGYPWEESDPALWEALWAGDYLPMIVHFPLVNDPGAEFEYSNLTSDWLGMIVARACDTDLKSFAEETLFAPLGVEVGDWIQDQDGYYIGHGEIHFTAREAAKFGLLYLQEGEYARQQVISADWVDDSLQTYSEDAWEYRVGRNFQDIGYGYQWWSATAGEWPINLAWGHGGQLIVLVNDLDMVMVVTADPLHGQTGDEPGKHEKANINLVADFIAALP
jgi:CubicO group peptidase (beta-lactamase class C family)